MDTKQYPITFKVHEWIIKGRKVLNKYLYTYTQSQLVAELGRETGISYFSFFY